MTKVVLAHDAQVYQYVEDEVVLILRVDQGLHNGNCIQVFFEHTKAINNRAGYYKKQYDVVPEFKAGLNMGTVTVAEVGEMKKGLAFHGDVLNTAARIQSKCNEFGKKLLVSEPLKAALREEPGFRFNPIGNVKLRGKSQTVPIYDVQLFSA
jgi:adenylate cyclase